jgi:retinol dehydrogenase-12
MSDTSFSLRRALRSVFVRPRWAETVDLRGKHAIVTGASPGSLGYETARMLAQWGAQVTVTSRSNTEALADQIAAQITTGSSAGRVSGHRLDLADASSVSAFASWYREHEGDRLDILVNNAGIHLDLLSQWKEPRLSDDGVELQWRTNFLGTYQLTRLLMPLLQRTGRESGDARVVNVVSQLHSKGGNDGLFDPDSRRYNSWVAYGRSKLALVHMTGEIQRRYAVKDNLQAFCLHPGAVYTNVAGKGLADTGLVEKVRNALAPVEAFFLLTPLEGAQTQLYCATSPGAEGGCYYRNCRPAKSSADAQDHDVAARLWQETDAWLDASKR